MVERLKKILKNEIKEDKWLINYEKVQSKELFFIKDKLDMNRAKNVEHCSVTVYKKIEEDGGEYLGSAAFKAAPGMTDEEIITGINDSLYSASLVKNPVFNLVKPTDEKMPQVKSSITFDNANDVLEKVIKLVYDLEKQHTAKVNSMEIFLQETETKIINSEGVDETFTMPELIIELVTDCKGEKEEVELYDMIEVSDFNEVMLKEKINADFKNVEQRAAAKKLEAAENVPVVLRGEAVCEIFSYYTFKSDAAVIYKKYSQMNVGDSVQSEDAKGDKVSITLLPEIPNSTASGYVDADGMKLHELPLIKDGKLLAYHGSSRYSQYCSVAATGVIPNVKIHEGSSKYSEMIKNECIEVLGFSDFQMDGITGDFGGEIRLALHHKDGKTIPVTGGSVTGNITDVQNDMLMSEEMDITGHYQHPKAIKIKGISLSC